MYLGQKKIEDGVDAELLATSLARRSTGMSGADISAVVNEAALMAAKQSNESGVTELDVHDALERVALGRERRSAEISVRAQEIVAWHEAGHAVVAMCLDDASKPERVSVVPRGGAGGATWFAGDEDEHFVTRSQAVANLAVAYGGRAAEELLLDGDFTQGASGDIAQATSRAERMVYEWGMSSYGMVRVDRDRFNETDDEARSAVRELLENAIEQAREVLSDNAALFRAVREQLAEKETLSAEDLAAIKDGLVS
jgi:cell division protease FtsH